MQTIFPGFEILGIYSFKINRDAELDFEEEYHADVLKKIERQLTKRNFGHPSRFLFEKTMPLNIQLFFTSALDLELDEMFGRWSLSQFERSHYTSFLRKKYYCIMPLNRSIEKVCQEWRYF